MVVFMIVKQILSYIYKKKKKNKKKQGNQTLLNPSQNEVANSVMGQRLSKVLPFAF